MIYVFLYFFEQLFVFFVITFHEFDYLKQITLTYITQINRSHREIEHAGIFYIFMYPVKFLFGIHMFDDQF